MLSHKHSSLRQALFITDEERRDRDKQALVKDGDNMNIGFIGAGRAGCSLGKYLSEKQQDISGFYDISQDMARSASDFVGTKSYGRIEELVADSDVIFITTPDGIITKVWEQLRKMPIQDKLVCHCSGALSSSSFSGIEGTGAKCLSIHPMLPFSNRFSSYQQLNNAFFTIEGDEEAVRQMKELFISFGNQVCRIEGSCKVKYHAAASMLSNQVIAVLDTGFHLLEACGFSRDEARAASAALIRNNIENVLSKDCVGALTGPIDRTDVETVKKHFACLDKEERKMYEVLGEKLVQIARQKNPDVDYTEMKKEIENYEEYGCHI